MLYRLILVFFFFLSLFTLPAFSVQEGCYSNMNLLIAKGFVNKIEETEWVIWNPKRSNAEIAHHRESPSGTWGFARLKEGTHSLHTHIQEEWYFIKQGTGTIQVGERTFKVSAGDRIHIPGNVKHAISKDPTDEEDLIFEYFFPNVKNYNKTVKYEWLD